jgi:hypothetical protein
VSAAADREFRREAAKALAAYLVGAGVFTVSILALANWLPPGCQSPVFQPATVITIPRAR